MSIFWQTDHVGADGDFVYARFAVDQWQTREEFERALDGYVGVVVPQMLAEFDRLKAVGE